LKENPVKKSASQLSAQHLIDTGNSAVMAGDSVLLAQIGILLGVKGLGTRRGEKAVLDRIQRTNRGEFEMKWTIGYRNQRCRVFRLKDQG